MWCWLGYLSGVRCIWFAWSSWCHCYPIISCVIRVQNHLTFLVLAYPGCPGKEATKRGFIVTKKLKCHVTLLSQPVSLFVCSIGHGLNSVKNCKRCFLETEHFFRIWPFQIKFVLLSVDDISCHTAFIQYSFPCIDTFDSESTVTVHIQLVISVKHWR